MNLNNILRLLVLITGLTLLQAGQTGKISGTITDAETGERLPGVNIVVNELGIGASTNIDGTYYILNVRPGVYTTRFMMIGYTTVVTEGVVVAMDQTTSLSQGLTPQTLGMEEVHVIATRPAVVRDLSASQLYMKEETIEALPIDNIASVIALQAGVQGTSVRGGGSAETSFIVDGFQLNDGRANQPNLTLSLSSVKEVQVQSGGFNAEYGNVRSGIINVITAEGGKDKYSGALSYYYTPAAPKNYGISPYSSEAYFIRPFVDDDVAWLGTTGENYEDLNSNHEWDLGEPYEDYNGDGQWTGWDGPTREQYDSFEGWNSFALRTLQDADPENDLTAAEAQQEWLWKHRRTGFITNPDHTLDFGFGGPVPGGRNLGSLRFYLSHRDANSTFVVPLSRDGYTSQTTRLKVNSDISDNMKLTMTMQYSVDESVSPYTWTTTPTGSVLSSVYSVANLVSGGDMLFTPAYYSPSDIYSTNMGLKLNHMLDESSFYEVVYQYLHSKYWTFETEARDTTLFEIAPGLWRDEAPFGYNGGEWMNLGRDSSVIRTHSIKTDYTKQFNEKNQFKTGLLFMYRDLKIRSFTESDKDTWRRTQIYDQPPYSFAAYVQDKLEYEGFIANLGLRVEFNNPNSPVYSLTEYDPIYGQGLGSDLEETADSEKSKGFWTVSPRLGVSHPITDQSKLYFNYGHFHSEPASTYRYRLQREANGQVTSIGNPDLELEQTIAYELGYSHSLRDNYLLNLTTYYKDISAQPGWVRYTNWNGSINYITPENNNYEDIRGIELTLSKLRGDWVTGFVNYTYMVQTSGFFGFTQNFQISLDQRRYNKVNPVDNRPLPTPYARMNLVFHTPRKFGPKIGGFYPLMNWDLSFLATYSSGSRSEFEKNSKIYYLSWLNTYNVNARLARTFETEMGDLEFFADATNLLNSKWLSSTGFSDSRDYNAYFTSLRLPWEEGIDQGDDHLGMYRDWDTEYRKFISVDSLSGVQGTPRSHEIYWDKRADSYHEWSDADNDWVAVSQSEVDQLIDDKAYIDMPNMQSMTFLNPRQITLGIRIKF